MADTDTEELPANSPSTPPSSTSTREPATVDGREPFDGPPSARPVVGRSVAEIRADLAIERNTTDKREWSDSAQRLLADVPQLLSEVEAAHRFEQSAAVEMAELVESLERVTGQRDAFRDERNSAVAERDEARAKARAVEMLHCWTNEDGRRFVFADDLATALGISS